MAALVADSDSTVAALAGIVALEIGTPPLRQAVDDARRKRPDLEVSAGRFLRELPSSEVADG